MLKQLFNFLLLGIKEVYSYFKYSQESYIIVDGALTFKKGFKTVHTRGVDSKKKIKKIIIPEGVLFIEDWFAWGLYDVEEIIIPESVTHIGDWFASYLNLQTITIPKNVRHIKSNFAPDCQYLKEIILPKSLQSLGYNFAYNCKSLERVAIPETFKEIDRDFLRHCKALKIIKLY
jgi:hypothetical protein